MWSISGNSRKISAQEILVMTEKKTIIVNFGHDYNSPAYFDGWNSIGLWVTKFHRGAECLSDLRTQCQRRSLGGPPGCVKNTKKIYSFQIPRGRPGRLVETPGTSANSTPVLLRNLPSNYRYFVDIRVNKNQSKPLDFLEYCKNSFFVVNFTKLPKRTARHRSPFCSSSARCVLFYFRVLPIVFFMSQLRFPRKFPGQNMIDLRKISDQNIADFRKFCPPQAKNLRK